VEDPASSRDHTERMLRALGATVENVSPATIRLQPPDRLENPEGRIEIPGDLSSAAFLIVAALLVPGSEIVLENVGLNPGRTGLLDALARMGARLERLHERDVQGEPVGDLRVKAGPLQGTEVGGAEVPRMIDEFPILAVAATQAQGETRVCDAAELRLKESDRVATVASELRKMGAQIEENPDGLIVSGPTRLRGARVEAHKDHRLAMALAVATLVAEGETVIDGWEAVGDSFPTFLEQLNQLRTA
jgi:3-phosphoshikimate 1-carboxyvinyltransferase